MNTVDAYCQIHKREFRWLTGSPLWCDLCQEEQLPQVSKEAMSPRKIARSNGKASDEEAVPVEPEGK